MTISYSISNTTNYLPVDLGPPLDPESEFPAIYGNINFGYTVTFTKTDAAITGIAASDNTGVTDVSVLSANSIRIERSQTVNVFPNEFFKFVEFDSNSQKIIETFEPQETDQAGPETSVFLWNTPPQKIINTSYNVVITYIDLITQLPSQETKVYTKELRWFWEPGLNQLADLVSKSRW
jgi:hypothetical protein